MVIEARTGSPRTGRALLLPLVLTAIVYLSTAGNRAVIDYDEGHYSQAALRMAEVGDWVTPYVNGVRFLEKPPLMYWLAAGAVRMFGANEFALRLPTALGVIALVYLVTLMGLRFSGERAAVIAGLCMACSVGTYLFTRETLPDIWLVLFVTLSMHAFLEWYRDPRHPLRHALLFYSALAGGVLTKSLVGLAFPVCIVVLFFLLARELPRWRTLHLLPGLLLFFLLAVPWHWLAAIRNQGFLYSFFVNEQILRFLGRHDPPVLWSVPLLTFWALIPLWLFPWTAFLPAAFVASRNPADGGETALTRLALAWSVVILGFFSIMGRLEHYSFPALPALALVVGVALSRPGETRAIKWGFRGLAILGLALLATGIGVGFWMATGGRGFPADQSTRTDIVYETDFSIMREMPVAIQRELIKPAAITIAMLAAGFLSALWFEIRHRRMTAVMSLAAAMVVFCGMAQWSLRICEDMISSKKFALAIAGDARKGDHLVVVGDYESVNSVNFYEPLRVEVFDGVAYALIPGMRYSDAPRVLLTRKEFEGLWGGGGRVFAIAPKDQLGDLKLGGTVLLQVLDRVLVLNH